MKTFITILLVSTQAVFGQIFVFPQNANEEAYQIINIDPVKAGKGSICDMDGKTLSDFRPVIRAWTTQGGVHRLLDEKGRTLAQIKFEAKQVNLYNTRKQLIYSYELDPRPGYAPTDYIIALTKSDDIVIMDPKTYQILDSYNFRIQDLVGKDSNNQGFSSIGSYIRIFYDKKGYFLRTEALNSEI